jgi:hypothetical protein
LRAFLLVVLSVGFVAQAAAGSEKSAVLPVNEAEGVGVKGYNPVAYFAIGRPTPGLDRSTYRLKGVAYRFASAEDLTSSRLTQRTIFRNTAVTAPTLCLLTGLRTSIRPDGRSSMTSFI